LFVLDGVQNVLAILQSHWIVAGRKFQRCDREAVMLCARIHLGAQGVALKRLWQILLLLCDER
jgi:hypothetical protein